MTDEAFDPARLLRVLVEHRVRFVLIGGLAGRLWGSPIVTNDVDICFARDPSNLQALTTALHHLNARLRGVPPGVPFLLDPETLERGDHFTFVTDAGNLGCLGSPSGSGGHDDLARTSQSMRIGEIDVKVSSLEDLIKMKEAAGRAKDRIEVEVLSALRDEIASGSH